jgi:hypothetical protein
METRKGDSVMVNLAPFIGSARRTRQSIPCRVLSVEADRLLVCADLPYRDVSLWVQPDWIERSPKSREGRPRAQRRYVAPVG